MVSGRRTADTIRLTNRMVTWMAPCTAEGLRGPGNVRVTLDEVAHFETTDRRPLDKHVFTSVEGTTIQTRGQIIAVTTPWAASGWAYETFTRYYGVRNDYALVLRAPSITMNPTLRVEDLARRRAHDPETYRAEYEAEFLVALSTLLDPVVIDRAVDSGIRERAPQAGIRYRTAGDPASGSGQDSFGFSIAHSEGEMQILDLIRTWRPPFSPREVIGEAAALAQQFNVREIVGDKYAPGFVTEAFASHGVTYKFAECDRSKAYLDLLTRLNAGACRLLDAPDLLHELRGLERRCGVGGRETVDHRPNSHDDAANAAALALTGVSWPRPEFRIL